MNKSTLSSPTGATLPDLVWYWISQLQQAGGWKRKTVIGPPVADQAPRNDR